jgi:hypothetical protein
MKKIIFFFFILSCLNSFSQNSCSHSETPKYDVIIPSFEKDSIDGVVAIDIVLISNDTFFSSGKFKIIIAGINSDSILVNSDSTYLIAGISTLYPNDTLRLSMNCSYVTSNLPFLPLDFVIKVIELDSNEEDIFNENVPCKLFFTPYNSLEVWNIFDFHNSKRIWLPTTGTNSRVYIPKSEIPLSDITDSIYDTLNYSVALRYYDYLPYAVPFNMPDTFNSDSFNFNELLFKKSGGCGPGRQDFFFRINNLRFGTWYDPGENGNWIWVPLRNAKVELRINRWPDQVINQIVKTDNDGYLINNSGSKNFSVTFCGMTNRNYDLAILVKMHDPENVHKFRAKYGVFNKGGEKEWKQYHMFTTHTVKIHNSFNSNSDITSSFVSSSQIGGVTANHYTIPVESLGLTYTLMRLVYDYSIIELDETGYNVMPNLEIKISSRADPSHYNNLINTITLHTDDMIDEGTMFHEFGHYFFDYIYGNWPNASGTHTGGLNNESTRMAMSEGVASGFQAILEEMTWSILDQHISINRHERQRFEERLRVGKTDQFTLFLNSPYLSERYVACVMLDLWDGPQNYLKFNNTRDPFEDDDKISSKNEDFIELPFKELMKVFYENRDYINNIQDFHDKLILQTDCYLHNAISQIFRYNLSNVVGISTNDFPVFNTDEIYTDKEFTVTGFKVKKKKDFIYESGSFVGFKVLQMKENVCEIQEKNNMLVLDGTNSNYNVTRYENLFNGNLQNDHSGQSRELADNHNFINGTTFQIFGNQAPGFWNKALPEGVTRNQFNGDFSVSVCNGALYTFDNSNFEIGSVSPSRKAIVSFKERSELTITNSILKINDNSTLIIEEGAIIRIGSGTEIILDGPNAILEIRGTLILETGVTFAPHGASNGLGFVRFNMPGINSAYEAKKRIILNGGSSFQFNGPISTYKLIEITDNVLWLDNNNDNSKTFTIDNGKIEMGENAVLNLGLRSIFNEVRIEPIGGTTDFKGVYLWGHRNTINNLQIKDCRNGLKCTNIVGGYPLLANGLVLDNCTSSLSVEGKGMVLKNSNIKNGNSLFGINVTGADLPSILQNTNIINVTNGVLFSGSKTASLSVTGSTLDVVINGVVYNAPATLFSRCSNYFGKDAGTGIRVASGSLEMAPAFGRTGGGNRLFNNSTTEAFNRSLDLVLAPIYLHNGINDLKFFGGSGNFAIFGRTKDVVIGGNMNASQNFWALPPIDVPTPFVNFLLFDRKIGPTHIVNVPSSSPFTIQSNFDAALATFCSNPTSSGGSGGTGNALITNPRNITWQTPNQNVKDVFEEILTNQYDTLYTSNVIPDWQSALTAAEWNMNMLPIDWGYIDIGITKMNEIAAIYLNNDTAFLDQPDTSNTHLSALSNVLNFWKARSDTSSSAEGQLVSQHIKFSKAGIYTLTNHYAKAMEIYTDLATTGDSSLFPLASYWLCQLYRMTEIKDAGTDYLFADSLAECDVSYPENYPEPFKEDVLIKGFNKPQMLVYPNPTNKIVYIQLTESTSANMIIFNSLGQLALEKKLSKSDKWSVDISTLPKGIYSIKIYLNESNTTLVQKLIVD